MAADELREGTKRDSGVSWTTPDATTGQGGLHHPVPEPVTLLDRVKTVVNFLIAAWLIGMGITFAALLTWGAVEFWRGNL